MQVCRQVILKINNNLNKVSNIIKITNLAIHKPFYSDKVITQNNSKMNTIRVTKMFEFEMAHALYNYNGKCRNLHGHTYKLEVTVMGKIVDDENHNDHGMIIDFSKLKKIVNENIIDKYDHALLLSDKTRLSKEALENDIFGRLVFVDYQPTCELMAYKFAEMLNIRLPEDVKLHHLKLYETSTSFAEWYAEDN